MALFFEFDFFIKSCRQFIGILAWTWAIFVFCLSYLGRGNYNHINNNNENGPPPLYQTVFVPILKVLMVAPSASLALPVHQQAVPWGQGVGLAVGGNSQGQPGSPGGFIFCAGCSPIDPQQLVLPSDYPVAKGIPVGGNGLLQGQSQPGEPGKQNVWEDGVIPVQQMSLSDDGRYSFSYNTAEASRQEERNLDGSVTGSYSYTDPEGKLVQIDYNAGPNGYRAYGDNVPPHPPVQLPLPVKDTPEVQEARAKFLATYARELARIQQDAATASTTTAAEVTDSTTASSLVPEVASTSTPLDADTVELSGDGLIVTGKVESEHKEPQDIISLKTTLDNVHHPIAVPPSYQVGGHGLEDEDELADSIVISADENDSQNVESSPPAASLPSPAYQITIPIGHGANAGVSVQTGVNGASDNDVVERVEKPNLDLIVPTLPHNPHAVSIPVPEENSAKTKSNLQPYFYYVSVGGSPHYVTSGSPSQAGVRSQYYPTSLKASLLGAIPVAAVHDSQVPSRGNNNMQQYSAPTATAVRPVYLDLDNSVQQQSTFQQQNQRQTFTPFGAAAGMQMNQMSNNPSSNNQMYVPVSRFNAPFASSSASLGYIPALFVNVGDGGATQHSTVQGSQNSLPAIFLSSVPQQSSTQNLNQPFYVLSRK